MKKLTLILTIFLVSVVGISADPYLIKFYKYVNDYREMIGLSQLERLENVENIAKSYSGFIADENSVNHHAITNYEFKQLCNNFGLYDVVMGEILANYPQDRHPYQVFKYFMNSEDHRLVLVHKDGQYIGAGYTTKNGRTFFTAYVVLKEK